MRLITIVAFAAFPAAASAGQGCMEFIAGRDHIIAGMYTQSGPDLREIYSFPLFATDRGLAYVTCPMADIDGTEGTICRAGILREKDGVLRLTTGVDIQGCQVQDHWNPDCPDFTADGFSQGNAANLAGALKNSAAQICAHFDGDRGLTDLTPANPEPQGPLGLDPGTYFRIVGRCEGADCDAMVVPDGIGTINARAGSRELACAVDQDGDLPICLNLLK